eukprot:g3444.t1 g3444   contig12:2088597-2090034(-)
MLISSAIRRQLSSSTTPPQPRWIHHLAPHLSPSNSKGDDSTTADTSKPNNNHVHQTPVQTLNKSPIVQALWKTRDEAKRRVMGNLTIGDPEYSAVSTAAAEILSEATSSGPAQVDPRGKHPKESEVGIAYPFSTDQFLLETYRNPWGEMRFGKILEDLDALAGNIAFNHVQGNAMIVTAGVDRIRVRRRPEIGADQYLSGKTKRAIKITPLIPETDEERVHFELGAVKAQAKKVARKNKIQIGRPLSEESLKIDSRAAKLLEEAGTLLRMPSLADPHTILMDQTAQSNAMVAQPQARNLHDRIFGGFLMRRAFELAFATCYMFGGDKPRFLEVDDISFDKPVDVGDLLVFKSRVLYTMPEGGNLGSYVDKHEGFPLVNVEVECWVTCPGSKRAEVSNHFYFTFALPAKDTCRRVLPANIDQARRMAQRMCDDEIQAGLRP